MAKTNRNKKQTRIDLSFYQKAIQPGACNWQVEDKRAEYWHDNQEAGRALFAEVAKLAEADELEAFYALLTAPTAPTWQSNGGIESGFMERMAAAAVIGMRAMRAGIIEPVDFIAERDRRFWGEAA